MALSISEEEVSELVGPDDAIHAVRAAHLALSRRTAVNIVRTRARTSKMSLQTMSAISLELGFAASKVYTARAGRQQSVVLLFTAPDGELVAILDANKLGRLRTTAASTLAAATLAPPGAKSLMLFGTGFQAEGVVKSYLARASGFSLEEILVYSRNAEARKSFADRLGAQLSANIVAVDSPADACKRSDIVVTATTSSEPVVNDEWLEKVHHISAIGANSLARKELPARVLTRADILVVDDVDVAKAESGNLLWPIENGKLQWADLVSLGEVLDHQKKISVSSAGLTIFLSHGLAVQDLFLAAEVYRRKTSKN